MYEQRNDFKSNTFVEVYIEGAIAKNVWLFNNLNRITELRNEQKQTPHILIKVLFKPENETLTQYSVNLNVTASQKLPVDLAGMTSQAASQHLNKTIYKEPLDAINDIEKAVAHILQNLKTSLGNSLAPNLLLRYNNDIYWSGHEITVLANEGNSVELEALDKSLQPIPSSELTWTNASPFMHKGVVDLTGLNIQQVSVQHKQGRQTDIASVTLKRVNVTENINDLLKLLIVEVLSAKKQESQDSVVRLKNDSIANAQNISRAILALESQNFPLEGGETPMALFNEGAQLLTRADEALFNNNTQRVTSFNLLKRRKALREGIRKKVNVVAFANLIVDQPEKVELLLDGLLRSSGQLVAQLILNQDQNGMRTAARNIVVDYLNKNIEAVAGSNFGFAQPAEPPLQISPNTTNNNMPIFKPDTYLYLNPMLDFEGKSEFITETNNYLSSLSEPLYIFINYSHDVSTESYLQRSSATRPKGLTDGVRFIALTLINIPGSTKFQLVGNKAIQLESAHSVREILKLYLEDDVESIMTKPLLTSKYVFMHDQLSTKSYASNIGTNEFTQEGVDYVDSRLYQLDTAGIKTYVYFAYIWFHAGNIERFEQLIENSFDHAIDSIKQNLGVKDFNLLAIVNAKYDASLANGLKTVSFREKFYPMSGLSSACSKSVDDYLKSGSKKTFVNGLDDALKERADILLQKLKNCEIIVPEEIVIHYKRRGRNKYRTWGEFTIVGTDYRGYILERPKGDNPNLREEDKRHPSGTYELGYSEDAGGKRKDFYYTTLYIAYGKPSYKLHCGNRVDQSDGCLLINENNPRFDKYPDAYQNSKLRGVDVKKSNVANEYPYGDDPHSNPNNPAFKLRNKVKELEEDITTKFKLNKVSKKIIIDESEEIEEL
jgi:hypothetical protein